ncbi:efflux RND transporter periplasmic adaptor subunit [Prosthecobacter sp.]|uniref:efflux RND transporter periplasmic adaptor subunit n=1 Tax=Prosthecobacter sp. TaxID=1965333 RepID=UPI003782DCE6
MKRSFVPLFLILTHSGFIHAAEDTKRASNTVVLDDTGVKNLRIETVEVEETDFEQTIFSLGRIESIPGKVAAVSSRISGRVVELKVAPGDMVKKDDEVAKIESRQPGDPPPVITLKAPLGGLITRVEKRLGDPLEPENALLEITDLSEVYAMARVPEHQAGRMKPGTVAHIKVAALPTEKFDGELLRFGTSADKESGTIDAIFRLTNPGGLLRADMRAEFSIVMSKRANVVSVPRAALQGESSNRFVYVKDFDLPNAFVKTKVQVGEMNDRFVEITSGLLPADEVVTRGAYSLSFAGASSVSLKEALDAAHGHEHAADGGELTPEAKAEMEAKKRAASGLPPQTESPSNPLWMYASGVLFVLLLISMFSKKRSAKDEDEVPVKPINKEAA